MRHNKEISGCRKDGKKRPPGDRNPANRHDYHSIIFDFDGIHATPHRSPRTAPARVGKTSGRMPKIKGPAGWRSLSVSKSRINQDVLSILTLLNNSKAGRRLPDGGPSASISLPITRLTIFACALRGSGRFLRRPVRAAFHQGFAPECAVEKCRPQTHDRCHPTPSSAPLWGRCRIHV